MAIVGVWRAIFPLAASTACMIGAATAQSSVVIYGRLNTAIEYSNATTATDGTRLGGIARLTNNRSVFGIRGEESLGYGLKAIWQVESTLSIDTGAGEIAARDTRLGLDSPYGTVFMGNWGTPYNTATKGYDPYYPTTAGYMALMGNGAAASTDNVEDTSSFDRRQQNSLHYQSPRWHGLSGAMAWGLPEEKLSVPRNPALYSFAGVYDNGALNVALAYEIHQHYQTAGRNDDGIKVGVSYQFPATTIALVYERLHYRTATGDLTRNSFYTSLVQKLGPGSVKVGFTSPATAQAAQPRRLAHSEVVPRLAQRRSPLAMTIRCPNAHRFIPTTVESTTNRTRFTTSPSMASVSRSAPILRPLHWPCATTFSVAPLPWTQLRI